VAEWRFDDGSGQVLTDYVGGFHGRLGSTTGADADDPTWTAQGLNFGGNDYVSLPSLPAVYGIDVVFKPASPLTTSSDRQDFLSNINDSGVYFIHEPADAIVAVKQETSAGYSASHRRAWVQGGGSISAAWHLLQCDVRPATQYWNIVLDGSAVDNATVNTPEPFRAGIWAIGAPVHFPAVLFYSGEVAYLIFYGSARTDQHQAQNRAALQSIMAARGITLP
jgi:hypothetical protein